MRHEATDRMLITPGCECGAVVHDGSHEAALAVEHTGTPVRFVGTEIDPEWLAERFGPVVLSRVGAALLRAAGVPAEPGDVLVSRGPIPDGCEWEYGGVDVRRCDDPAPWIVTLRAECAPERIREEARCGPHAGSSIPGFPIVAARTREPVRSGRGVVLIDIIEGEEQ